MKAKKTAEDAAYSGAVAGLVLFAFLGLFRDSSLVRAINIAESVFSLPKLVIGVSMIGTLLAGFVFIAVAAAIGWVIGRAINALRFREKGRGMGEMHPGR